MLTPWSTTAPSHRDRKPHTTAWQWSLVVKYTGSDSDCLELNLSSVTTSYVMWGHSLNLSVPRFPHVQNRAHKFTVGIKWINEFIDLRAVQSTNIYRMPALCQALGVYSRQNKNIPALGASRVAQWLRICLPMQGTRVRALVWEDLTCRGATRPVSHNY